MDRVVTKPIKVDLHLHSVYSKYKDEEDLVKYNNEDNIGCLVDKLKDNSVNMASITDHDYFSYDMYKLFKSYEGKGSLKKVLPGIEFSVGMHDEKNELHDVHVIAIFDDKDDEKIKKIEKNFKVKNNQIDYNNGKNMFFSEERVISILNAIGLNVVLIAHQKNSVESTKKSKNDLMNVGKDNFHEYLSCEVFEALEFKSMKNGLFNRLFAIEKNRNYDIVRFITGSDCHMWSVYPKHDSNSKDDDFHHTYLKCLPTFKGLEMAITYFSRIS